LGEAGVLELNPMSRRRRSSILRVVLPAATLAMVILSVAGSPQPVAVGQPSPGAELGAYGDTLAAIGERKDALLHLYREAQSEPARTLVRDKAREEIARSVASSIAPFWLGTPWDFNGATETPAVGTIACGYFVTTVLRDAGFNLERVLLAQEPSETIIMNLVGSGSVRRFSDAPFDDFIRSVEEWGHGLYMVGLDIHVGFIVYDTDGIFFIHSSYREPLCVVRERAEESSILAASHYRVLGKLTGDDELIVKWLTGERTVTRVR
jgi:hypothetical protein